MFVNPKELKKLMQEAYKASNLVVGNTGKDYYIQGLHWKVLCKKEFITKTILAAIIELAGEIPEEGECFCASKAGNQMQVNPMRIEKGDTPMFVEVTDFVLVKNGTARILQSPTGQTFLINNNFINMTTGKSYDQENGEVEPKGPFIVGGCQAYWMNNVMEFITLLRGSAEHESVLEEMEMIDLTKKTEL